MTVDAAVEPKRKRGPSRPAARLAMGANAVLSLAQAVDLLPLDRVKARQWLKDRNLVRTLAEHEVVIWGDVLDALRAGSEVPAPARSTTTFRRERV